MRNQSSTSICRVRRPVRMHVQVCLRRRFRHVALREGRDLCADCTHRHRKGPHTRSTPPITYNTTLEHRPNFSKRSCQFRMLSVAIRMQDPGVRRRMAGTDPDGRWTKNKTESWTGIDPPDWQRIRCWIRIGLKGI